MRGAVEACNVPLDVTPGASHLALTGSREDPLQNESSYYRLIEGEIETVKFARCRGVQRNFLLEFHPSARSD